MSEGPNIARIASLIGERGRSQVLMALMGGQALTATELADAAGVTRQTASAHLARLLAAKLIAVEHQGRHRYFRIAGPEIAHLLESLMHVAAASAAPLRVGPTDPLLRKARVCYDHLAGELGVFVLERLRAREWLIVHGSELQLSAGGIAVFQRMGIDASSLAARRRPVCRACLDWSERRHHLAGSAGAALLARIFELNWAQRARDSRIVQFTRRGEQSLRALFA